MSISQRRWLWIGLLTLAVALGGCGLVRRLELPLDSYEYRPDGKPSATLIVFLPGIFDPSAEGFARYGFMQAVRDRGIDADMVAVDANVRYYGEGVVVERLRNDVMRPALTRGYRRVILVGISMGGFGALLYARKYPAEVDAVILLAPLLPDENGGRRDPATLLEQRNRSEHMWRWLESNTGAQKGPKIYLAYGESDKFATVNARLAALLPPDQVERSFGEHDWATWSRLWATILQRGWLSRIAKSS